MFAPVFGPIEGNIAFSQKVLQLDFGVAGHGRDADAHRQRLHRSGPGEMFPDRLDHGVGFVNQPVDAGFAEDGDEKFIPAHPHTDIVRAKRPQQPTGSLEDLVPEMVAVTIVDLFEVVQVDIQEADAVRRRVGIDVFVKIAASIQAGELVGVGDFSQLIAKASFHGHIAENVERADKIGKEIINRLFVNFQDELRPLM